LTNSTPAQLSLKAFSHKPRPTGWRPAADGDALMAAGIMDEWTLKTLGSDIDIEELLSLPVDFEWFANKFSAESPLSLDQSDCDIIVRLCDASGLARLTEGLDTEVKRECFLRAGHYEHAKSVEGWEDFATQPYPWKDAEFRDMGITNGDAYGLCHRFQTLGVEGNSPAMIRLYLDIARLAQLSRKGQTPIVLIEGGHGSGKGAIAKALHDLACRTGEFVRLNMSAITAGLVESALFGHEKGAFTGATEEKRGAFEECVDGTLVLDDLNHMNREHLTKLLQALEERTITRVGANTPVVVKTTMVVVTSNVNLAELDNFPPDVLERMHRHVIKVPDMISRVSDVPNLTQHFFNQEPGCEEIAGYRFQIAKKLRMWARDDVLSVRSIRNEIGALVRESQDVTDVIENRDPHEQKILATIQKLYPTGERPVKARVAAEIGIGKSTLSDTSTQYGNAWSALEAKGEIHGWGSGKRSETEVSTEHDP